MKKILIIEDDKFLREVIAKKLTTEGYELIEAVNGENGITQAGETKPNLILLDLILPGIDGFGVLTQLKENTGTKEIPIIILSNLSQENEIKRALALGAADFLIKANFTPSEIIKKIKKIKK